MDEDPPQGLGWFAEAHNLQEGEKANVVLGEDFHTNEVELLNLNDELLKVIEDGGELTGRQPHRVPVGEKDAAHGLPTCLR